MFLHVDAVTRCSRAARVDYREWGITGLYRDGTVTHERNQNAPATIYTVDRVSRIRQMTLLFRSRVSLIRKMHSQCTEINPYRNA